MHKLAGAAFILFAAFFTIAMQQQTTQQKSYTVSETFEVIKKDTSVILLDVRTPAEWKSEGGHLKGALLIPMQELDERLKELEPYKQRTIIAYCRSGHRSGNATKLLTTKGFNVFNMEGGMIRWNAEQYPVVKENTE